MPARASSACPAPGDLRLRPVPDTEPPYDEEVQPRHLALVPPVRPAAEPLPFDGPGPRLGEDPVDLFNPQPTPRAVLPEPRGWLVRLIRVVLECLEGWRPPGQLCPYATDEAVAEVAAKRKRVPQTSSAPQVRSLHVTEPVTGVVEACAVVCRDGRYQAIALRLEGLDGRWRCVALHVVAPTGGCPYAGPP